MFSLDLYFDYMFCLPCGISAVVEFVVWHLHAKLRQHGPCRTIDLRKSLSYLIKNISNIFRNGRLNSREHNIYRDVRGLIERA